MPAITAKSLLDQIDDLSSAEDFFVFFLLPFDQEVLNTSRLHIMKRMGQYLAGTDFTAMDEDAIFLEARLTLKRAYGDFLESTPLAEKVFKVFADQARKTEGRFVPLGDLAIQRGSDLALAAE